MDKYIEFYNKRRLQKS
ncbi:MAG: hypothetical protein ACLSWP_06145 [Terrisporobacter sp.]